MFESRRLCLFLVISTHHPSLVFPLMAQELKTLCDKFSCVYCDRFCNKVSNLLSLVVKEEENGGPESDPSWLCPPPQPAKRHLCTNHLCCCKTRTHTNLKKEFCTVHRLCLYLQNKPFFFNFLDHACSHWVLSFYLILKPVKCFYP